MKLTMLDVRVEWFNGDNDGPPVLDEDDPPGWVPFVVLSDGTLSYTSGLGSPFRSREAATFAGYFIVWDRERQTAEYTGPPMSHERAPRNPILNTVARGSW